MPIFVAPPNRFSQNDCVYDNADENKLEETFYETTDVFQEAVTRFEEKVKSAISSADAGALIRYSNFLSVKVLQLIDNSGCTFIRVFNAIDASGDHFTFMVPLDAAGTPMKSPDTIYLAQCCACPPKCRTKGDL